MLYSFIFYKEKTMNIKKYVEEKLKKVFIKNGFDENYASVSF